MNERGSVTFWMLGLAFALLTLGVLSVDLWALIAERRELTSMVDAAATAAASAVDEAQWRGSHQLALDRGEATRRAWAEFARQGGEGLVPTIEFGPDGVTVRVSVARSVPTALLGLAGRERVTVGASSAATAVVED